MHNLRISEPGAIILSELIVVKIQASVRLPNDGIPVVVDIRWWVLKIRIEQIVEPDGEAIVRAKGIVADIVVVLPQIFTWCGIQ